MIDVSELMYDPDFSTTFQLIRKKGEWVDGRWVEMEKTSSVVGIVMGVNKKDLELMPEGDRLNEMRAFYCEKELQVTGDETTSDICEYKGKRYRLIYGFDYSDFGYYKAIGVKLGGV